MYQHGLEKQSCHKITTGRHNKQGGQTGATNHGQAGTTPGSKLPGALTDWNWRFSLVHYIKTLNSAEKSGPAAKMLRGSLL